MSDHIRVALGSIAPLSVLASPVAHAADIGIFDESIHANVEIRFQIDPVAVVPTMVLVLGLPSSLVPPSPGYSASSSSTMVAA